MKSNKTWEVLQVPDDLLDKLYENNFKNPSKIQSDVLTLFNSKAKTDLIAQSQNGSGKTLSFLVPSIRMCLESDLKPQKKGVFNPNILVLADTKELCYQTLSVARKLLVKDLKAAILLTSDLPEEPEWDANILITTIGSLFSFLNKKKLVLNNMKFLVIDETDKLFQKDYGRNKIIQLFERIGALEHYCCIGMFSATFPEECLKIIYNLGRQVAKLVVKKEDINLKNLTHFFVQCSRPNKLEFMNRFLRQYSVKFFEGSVIVFVNSKNFAD